MNFLKLLIEILTKKQKTDGRSDNIDDPVDSWETQEFVDQRRKSFCFILNEMIDVK